MMILSNQFDRLKTMETFSHCFNLSKNKSIKIELISGEFEHYFIIIRDPKGQLRALFTFKTRQKCYYIGENLNECSNGAIAGKMYNGEWEIKILKTYDIKKGYKIKISETTELPKENLPVDALAADFKRIFDTQKRYYLGDLHMHSNYSDGRVTLNHVYESALGKGLSYVSHTDHSVVTTKYPGDKIPNIPGTEITWDDYGHYNIFGLTEIIEFDYYIEKYLDNKSKAINEMLIAARRNNMLTSINHPFARGIDFQHDLDVTNFTNLEVINAPHLFIDEIDNLKACSFFDFLWLNGHKLYALGGSDAHKDNYYETYPVGEPTTKIFCDGLSISNLLLGMKNGNTIVQAFLKFEVEMFINDQIVYPGNHAHGNLKFKARTQEVVKWNIICNGEVIHTSIGKTYNNELSMKEQSYYRLEAWYDGEIILFVNPVYNMDFVPTDNNFLSLLKNFEDEYVEREE